MSSKFSHMSNKELIKALGKEEWLNKELLDEYDRRYAEGAFPPKVRLTVDQLSEYLHNRYSKRRKKAF